ncbi:HNH endonuclease [Nocardioides daphniae]|uniref:HNH endonuclease n=1 Tax=Nocardioides daphniae TaxID=402297 RepID=A0A4P7UDL9_9ACTN|nr:HNH endonuclease signature motif containing protein [Nocardioides daphniae]QCC78186.1 HNH endonuclease [Nocardioides daphniae]
MEATTRPADSATAAELLRELGAHRQLIAAAEAEELELVYAWVVSHPALGEGGVLSADEFPGGAGTPGVAAFTAEPLAGVLRVSPASAQSLLADTVDLVHRLPRLWDQVQALEVAVWKARRIATATRSLSLEAARWVDRQMIGAAGSIGAAALDRLIALAVARIDPAGQKEKEAAERAKWDVDLTHPRGWAGTSQLTAVGDTVALGEVMDRISADADALAGAGDADTVGARRVKALLSLAREGVDQLAFGFAAADAAASKTGRGAPRQALKVYVHASLADLATLGRSGNGSQTGAEVAIAEVERFGPITTDLLKQWLGGTKVTVTPVLDLADTTWSPPHDPPPRTRDQVVLRHHGCVFPFCGRDARAGDLDHVVPWDPDGHATPGTTPDNLAPLCRRHHRAKTDGRWRYVVLTDRTADPPGRPDTRPGHPPDHLWTDPTARPSSSPAAGPSPWMIDRPRLLSNHERHPYRRHPASVPRLAPPGRGPGGRPCRRARPPAHQRRARLGAGRSRGRRRGVHDRPAGRRRRPRPGAA